MAKTKKGRISKNETYIIQGLLSDGKSTEFIAKELDRPVSVINKYVDSKRTEEDVQEIDTTKKSKGISSLDLMTSKDRPKGNRPIVMTKSASERGERFAENPAGFTNRHDNCIFNTDGESLTDGK